MALPKIAAFPSHNLPQMRATRCANLLGLARRRHPHLPGSRPGAWGGYHPKYDRWRQDGVFNDG